MACMGAPNHSSKSAALLNTSGMRKFSSDHSSPILFCRGVPGHNQHSSTGARCKVSLRTLFLYKRYYKSQHDSVLQGLLCTPCSAVYDECCTCDTCGTNKRCHTCEQ